MKKRTQAEANEAAALLDNRALQQARDDVRETLIRRLERGEANPRSDREIVAILRGAELYWKILRGRLKTGDVEVLNLERLKKEDVA